jgi:hypothetical protein
MIKLNHNQYSIMQRKSLRDTIDGDNVDEVNSENDVMESPPPKPPKPKAAPKPRAKKTSSGTRTKKSSTKEVFTPEESKIGWTRFGDLPKDATDKQKDRARRELRQIISNDENDSRVDVIFDIEAQVKKYRDTNKDKLLERNRRYRSNNKEKVALKQKECQRQRYFRNSLLGNRIFIWRKNL